MRLDFIAIWLEAISNTFRGRRGPVEKVDQCLNCGYKVSEDLSYCPNCGQKLKYSYVTIRSLFAEFFYNLFDLDNTIFRSLRKVIIPGFLPQEYMEGRRKMYLNPVRFFFVALVILFSVATFTTGMEGIEKWAEGEIKTIGKSEFKGEFLTWRDSLPENYKAHPVLDSLENTLLKNINEPEKDSMTQNLTLIGVDMQEKKFLRKDMYEMNIDTLLVQYDISKFWERLVISQYIRTIRNPSGAIQFFIGNILWGIISTIFLLGLVLKLLYIRRKRFYVEHIMLLFNVHTFSFLLLAILSVLKNWFPPAAENALGLIGALTIVPYGYMSMKRYYQQGHIKTGIKYILSAFFYFFIILMMISIVFVASILLY